MLCRTLIAVSGTLLLAGALSAQAADSNAYRHRLLGVFDLNTGDAIEGAEVTDVLAQITALTTKTGTISLAFLPDGGSLVRVRKVGYQPTTITVAISPVDTLPVTVMLTVSAVSLPTVVTKDSAPGYSSARMRAFDERRKQLAGSFITEDELRKNDNSTMANLLKRIAGMSVVCNRSGSDCRATSTRTNGATALGKGNCPAKVFVDGMLAADSNLQIMMVNEYAGVEYYAGASIPTEYNLTGSSCAVLLLWGRDR